MQPLDIPRVLLNATYRIDNDTSQVFEWTLGSLGPWADVELPLVIGESAGTNTCNEFKTTGDLTGKIALVRMSTCSDSASYKKQKVERKLGPWQKAEYAVKKGAEYVLFYSETEW